MRLKPEERHVYNDIIQYHSLRFDVPQAYIKATIGTESFWDESTVNLGDPGGAWGLMQLTKATALWMHGGSIDPWTTILNPFLNVQLGTKYLAYLMKRFPGAPSETASAYNGGHPLHRTDGAFVNHEYVDRWLRWYAIYRQLPARSYS